MLGHNNGPTLDGGAGWRRFAWGRARAELLPKLPVEVVRIRLKRAKELGLEYKSYASIRAASGRDVIAFLFSSNALRVFSVDGTLPQNRAERLAAIKNCGRLVMTAPPIAPESFAAALSAQGAQFNAVHRLPVLTDSWSDMRAKTRAALGNRPAAGVVMVGDTGFERDCAGAARLGAYLPADVFFPERSGV